MNKAALRKNNKILLTDIKSKDSKEEKSIVHESDLSVIII
jgi:hypothetical protein